MQIREYIAENSIIEFMKQLEESEGYAEDGYSLGLRLETPEQLWSDSYTDEEHGHLTYVADISNKKGTVDDFRLVLSGYIDEYFGYYELTFEEL